jgi:hypothetical protein
VTVDPILAGSHAVALTGLAGGYRPRPVTPLMPWRLDDGWLVKPYVVTARGKRWDDELVAGARAVAARQLGFDGALGGLGLAVVVLHLGADGVYLVVQSWTAGYQSRLTVFTGVDVDGLRPAPIGLAPCVWEQQVLSHELTAYVEHILRGDVDTTTWLDDVLDTRQAD